MALNQNQKTRILFYLGWSGLTLVQSSTHFNSVVFDRINDNSEEESICRILRELLEKLEGIDQCLSEAKCRLAASSVDNIKTNPKEIDMLNKERRRCIRELADLIDVPILRSGGAMVGVCK